MPRSIANREEGYTACQSPLYGNASMPPDSENSLSDDVTFPGQARRQQADVSLGDERTLGDGLSGEETIVDEIDIVDLAKRYTIERELGQGGMGAVLLASDNRLGRKVAIKRIRGEAASNRMAVNRFLTEAKAIAALNHPNIVQIYDYGRAKDGPFLTMEYVDGGSLLDRCRDGAMPLEQVIDMVCHVCDGLAKAHDLGIIHRDIKPANVLLTKDGIPKLTDFGLAKAAAGDHGQTMTGAVLGTPDFMPPEQRKDSSLVDHRSDLWSLAATVYQMATGRSPKIIRFDLLPAGLTKVLGKALEDTKDDRYQTARELRDALKASLRAATPDASAVAEGQCASCGVQNDASRRFCRGCGGSLEAPCLTCDKPMPIGEEICGSCGAKQTPLVEARRSAMAAEQVKAEGLLGDYAFDDATRVATALRDEPHARLFQLKAWAEGFLVEIENSRSRQVERAAESLFEAARHEEAHDYLSAIFALGSVPAAMRSTVLPGARETVGKALDRLKKTQAEVLRLESLVRERLTAKSLDGLLVEVDRLLTLQPERSDGRKLKDQLLDRQARQAAARDKAIAAAAAMLDAHDYEAALSTLKALPPSAIHAEASDLQKRASSLAAKVLALSTQIRESVAAKQFDGLLVTVDAYLTLKPADSDVLKLRQTLIAREEKVAAEIVARLKQAKTLEQACRFGESVKILEGIPAARRDDATSDILGRCRTMAAERSAALKALTAPVAGAHAAAIRASVRYQRLVAAAGLDDAEFKTLLDAAEAGQAADERVRQQRRTFAIAAAAVAVFAALVGGGIWRSSHQRTASLAKALKEARLDDALAIDPNSVNADAFLRRASAKFTDRPPDIDGAFADIERAEKLPRGSVDLIQIRGAAHAARAADHARADRLVEAALELDEAVKMNADAQYLAIAREAIAAVWIARAETVVKKGDAEALGSACDSARKAGASPEQVSAVWFRYGSRGVTSGDATAVRIASDNATKAGATKDKIVELWQKHADACVTRLDASGLETACVEATQHGMPSSTAARMWIRFGEESLKKENAAGVETACEAASKAGALDEDLRPLRARAMILEALGMSGRGEAEAALAKAMQAVATNASASIEMLVVQSQSSKQLREGIVREYRKRFETAMAAGDLKAAMELSSIAARIEPQAQAWLASSLTPDALQTLSSATLAALPSISNSIGLELKLLPPGTFMMGQAGAGSDEIPRRVTLTRPFYIGVYEVTNAQWKQVMGSVPSRWKEDDLPVEQVSWRDAVRFCETLSDSPEERAAGRVYRLPTEAEWEYACRAGTTTRFSFGDDDSKLVDFGWFDGNSGRQTHPVGEKKPNVFGLYDMHGNVWEWVSDWYEEHPTGEVTDPQGPPGGSDRVRRGGSWGLSAWPCRSATRYADNPSGRNSYLGFRLALSSSGGEPPAAGK